MNVLVVGCGALGSLLAFKMLRAGIPVRVLQRKGAQYDALKTGGIRFFDSEGRMERVFCEVVSVLDGREPVDLALVTVKTYQTEEAAMTLQGQLAEKGIALTLQNGLGNAEILAKVLGAERVAAGICTYGAHRRGPGEIAWGGDGVIRFGPWKAGVDVSAVEELLRRAGMETLLEGDPRKALWEKVILNAAVNPVSALTRTKNGLLLESSETLDLVFQLVEEGVLAARSAGEKIETGPMRDLVRSVLEKTANNRTSMLQDVENGRRTEAEAILGRLLSIARQKGNDLIRMQTLYALIRGVETAFEKRGSGEGREEGLAGTPNAFCERP